MRARPLRTENLLRSSSLKGGLLRGVTWSLRQIYLHISAFLLTKLNNSLLFVSRKEAHAMPTKIIYLPMATHIARGLEDTIAILSAKVMAPEGKQLWPEDIMPLVDAVRDLTELAGKVEAMTQYFEYR